MPAEPLSEKESAEPGVAAVNRALTILQAFEHSIDGLTLTDLMKETGLYHSTILRLCESLEHYRYLKRLPDGRYMLGPAPFYLGMIYQSQFRLQDYVLPVLRELTRSTHETSALYVREGDHRICLHRMELPRRVRMTVPEGDRVELERGAAGKVLLAFAETPTEGKAFDDIRTARHAVSLAERDSETAAIACPAFDGAGRVAGAISLGIPLFRFTKAKYAECLPFVAAAARQLTSDLGGNRGFYDEALPLLKGLKIPNG